MKGQIDFPNVADKMFADLQDKQYRQRAWERKRFYAPDNKYSIFERIGMLAGCLIFSIAMISLIIVNADSIDNFSEVAIKFLNNLTAAFWTIFTAVGISLILGYFIVRSAKRSRVREGIKGRG